MSAEFMLSFVFDEELPELIAKSDKYVSASPLSLTT